MRTRTLPLLVIAIALVLGSVAAGCSEEAAPETTAVLDGTATTAPATGAPAGGGAPGTSEGEAPATTAPPAEDPDTTTVPTTSAPPATSAPSPEGPGDTAVPTTSTPETTQAPPTYETVGVRQAYQELRTNKGAQMVDVREPAEWAETGVPPDAILISLGDLQSEALDELKEERPVYVICRSGNRSRTASEILVGLGFSEVYNVDGGIRAWIDAGLPVVPYEP